MRRITIFTDEETAQKVVPWLEQHGVDFMSEDYAEPSLARRSPPSRRSQPERHEPSKGFLEPLKPVKSRRLRDAIRGWVADEETINRGRLRLYAQRADFNPNHVKDTVRRMLMKGELEESLLSGDLSLPAE
jgi:hypothetical protein